MGERTCIWVLGRKAIRKRPLGRPTHTWHLSKYFESGIV
jgi:hypothetical protein